MRVTGVQTCALPIFKHKEAQALFALQAKAQEDKLVWMSKNDSFTKFTIANDYLFS
jgi:hypothetical protein